MLFLAAGPDVTPITDLILTWTHIGQALVGSIGALAFIFALLCTGKLRLQLDDRSSEDRGYRVKAESAVRCVGRRSGDSGGLVDGAEVRSRCLCSSRSRW